MKAAVLGAGAVGCYFGGMLARAGHAVTLIGRPLHVEAIRRSGLRFEAKTSTNACRSRPAPTRGGGRRGARAVLREVYGHRSRRGADRPHLDAGALLVNLQNGVDNTERIQARVPAR